VADARALVMGRLMEQLEGHGDRTALVTDSGDATFRELTERSNRLANALLALGVRAGERVAFAFGNGPEIVGCYLACAKSGIVGVPISERLTEDEVLFELDDSEAVALICYASWAERMLGRRAELRALRLVICDRPRAGCLVLAEVEAAASPALPGADLRPSDLFCVMYTGGTTGVTKAALQTHENWAASVETVVETLALRPEDRHVVVLPMAYVAWFTVPAHLYAGAQVTIASRWDPAAVLRTVGEQGITTLNMIPTMLGDLLAAVEAGEPAALGTLRLLTVAGSPMSLDLLRRAQRTFGPIIGNLYGMTETSGPVSYLLPEDLRDETIVSGGRPSRHVEVAVLDESDRLTSGSTPGEIVLRGPQVTPGYLNRTEETDAAFAGGWFHTGDVGYLGDDRFLYIVDRKKDMIKSGGFNVYPQEVEEVLYRHSDVIEAAVIGVPDPRWMEAVQAIVVVRGSASVRPADLIAHCRPQLARHKVPKVIHIVDRLPRTGQGKFDKRELRRRFADAAAPAA
jgi:acyl-CoA synthetase (AMP-forming)/AMP-acid ligase II